MKRLSLPLIACLLTGAACWPFSGEGTLGSMTLRKAADGDGGKIEIVRRDETIVVRDKDVPVKPGDIVRTYEGALAQVALEGDRVAWVGGNGPVVRGAPDAQMRIADTTSVESDTGTVVAEAEDAMTLRFGDATATARDAVFRVDRRAGSSRAASYHGDVQVTAPGEATVSLSRLREAPATAGDLRRPQPYSLDPNDPFDAQHLEPVIDLEAKLGGLSVGLASQLGRQKPGLDYFRALSGRRNVKVLKPYLRRPAIELLLGFLVADHAKDKPFPAAVRSGFRDRDDGGTWGVVAFILRSDPKLLVAGLNKIIVGSGAVVAGGPEGDAFSIESAQAAQAGVAPPSDGGRQPNDDDRDTNNKPPPKKEPKDPDDPPKECTSGPECDVQEVRDRILPSPSPTGIMDGLLGS